MLEALEAARAAGRPVALVTPLDGSAQQLLGSDDLRGVSQPLADAVRSALATDRAVLLADGGIECLVAPRNPPLRLVIVGAVHIAEALCPMAQLAGYAVTLIDPRSAFLRADRFASATLVGEWPQQAFASLRPDARTAIVLLTHDPKIDDPALQCVLRSPVFYIGALGSTRTHARRLERLAALGYAPQELARIAGPAGLDIGARTPAEIAVSVLAQMTRALRRGTT